MNDIVQAQSDADYIRAIGQNCVELLERIAHHTVEYDHEKVQALSDAMRKMIKDSEDVTHAIIAFDDDDEL